VRSGLLARLRPTGLQTWGKGEDRRKMGERERNETTIADAYGDLASAAAEVCTSKLAVERQLGKLRKCEQNNTDDGLVCGEHCANFKQE